MKCSMDACLEASLLFFVQLDSRLSRKNFSSLSSSHSQKFFFLSIFSLSLALSQFSLSLSRRNFPTPTFSVLISFRPPCSDRENSEWCEKKREKANYHPPSTSSNIRNRAQNLYIIAVISVFSVQLTHTLSHADFQFLRWKRRERERKHGKSFFFRFQGCERTPLVWVNRRAGELKSNFFICCYDKKKRKNKMDEEGEWKIFVLNYWFQYSSGSEMNVCL